MGSHVRSEPRPILVRLALLGALAGPAAAQADDSVYHVATPSDLGATEGKPVDEESAPPRASIPWDLLEPRVVLETPGEAYVDLVGVDTWMATEQMASQVRVVSRSPAGAPLRGLVILPFTQNAGARVLRFELADPTPTPGGREAFLRAKLDHYERLTRAGADGAAWFRHQAKDVRAALGEPAAAPDRLTRDEAFDAMLSLFTGTSAVAENLQLDRRLAVPDLGERTIDVDSLPGIDVAEIDWAPLIAGLAPATDPLAAWIPADQHAVLFPSFTALTRVLDQALATGTPVLDAFEPRTRRLGLQAFYERQLCLPLDAVTRALGSLSISSVALTGSDPYLPTGTDLALLFETARPDDVLAFVQGRQAAAARADAAVERADGELDGHPYAGVLSADRAVSSYAFALDGAVLVASSLAQARRILAAHGGDAPTLATTPEYVFFRDRYPRGADDETAFVILTDAAIRRWCGPRWRIGDSRRTRALAALYEEEAAHAAGILTGTAPRARSDEYGTTRFLTPVTELDVSRVTPEEKAAYERFRTSYQANWRGTFDPIAARLSLGEHGVSLDLSVMPLIAGSDYADLVDLTRGGSLEPGSGDPHPEALVSWTMALDMQAAAARQASGLFGGLSPELSDPFGWVGGWLSLFADDSPFWKEWRAADDPSQFIETHLSRLPVALEVAVKEPLRLATFLTTLRAFSNQAAPDMTVWENREHAGRTYVRVGPSAEFASEEDELKDVALYYAVLPHALVLTLDEDVLQRAIDRDAARREAGQPTEAPLGKHLELRMREGFFDALKLVDWSTEDRMQTTTWRAIPILDEWKRLFPDRDPLAVQETLYHERLVPADGGDFVWDPDLATMSSPAYGSPEGPREPALATGPLAQIRAVLAGLSFETTGEASGLRLRVSLETR